MIVKSSKKDWNLILAIISTTIALITAIPQVYDFDTKKFFWEPKSPEIQKKGRF
jgi:hypothetical protein